MEKMQKQFCPYCGTKLEDGVQFCQNCGEAIHDDAREAHGAANEQSCAGNPSERTTVYEGYIHKCPNCGEVLNAFASHCPSCGYELRGAQSTNAIKDFSLKIEQAELDEQKVTLIRNFPVPNTKEDIFEFMILASTNITGEQQKKVFDAWLVKFEQSYQKAQLVIKDPSDMAQIKTIYDKTQKKIGKEKLWRNAKAAGDTISQSASFLKKIIFLIGKNAAVIAAIVLFVVAISTDRSGGNSSGYELIGVVLLIASAATLTRRDASLLEILIGADSGVVSLCLANFLDNGSMLELGGAVVLIIAAVSFFKKLSKKGD